MKKIKSTSKYLKLTKITKPILKILDINKTQIHNELRSDERSALASIRNYLEHGNAGRSRPGFKNKARLGSFVFISLDFPSFDKNTIPKFHNKTLKKYKYVLVKSIKNMFGEDGRYVIGFQLQVHAQSKDDRNPEFHFHLILSRVRFKTSDQYAVPVFNALSDLDKKQYSLFFLTDPLMDDADTIASSIEPMWREIIKNISRISVPENSLPLVTVSTKEQQDFADRKRVAKYVANNAKHTFRKLRAKPGNKDGDVVLSHLAAGIETVNGRKTMTETIFGSNFDVMEKEAESQIERDGIVQMRQWSSKRTRESIAGTLQQVAEVGHWVTDDDHVAVVMAVSNLPLESSLVVTIPPADADLKIPDYPDWNVEPDWEYVLLTHPRLLKGGAILYPDSGEWWVIGVGAAKLTGNQANDQINAPRAAEMDARRNIIKYLVGFSSKSNTDSLEELQTVINDSGMESSTLIESLNKMTQERANGFIRNMRRVGLWKSEDRKLLYQVYVIDISNAFDKRTK